MFIIIMLCGIVISQPVQPAAKSVQTAAKPFNRVYVPIPNKQREYVPPETVGVPKDCPFPTVSKPIKFVCPCCGLWMKTNLLYHHLPQCHRDGCVMKEE